MHALLLIHLVIIVIVVARLPVGQLCKCKHQYWRPAAYVAVGKAEVALGWLVPLDFLR